MDALRPATSEAIMRAMEAKGHEKSCGRALQPTHQLSSVPGASYVAGSANALTNPGSSPMLPMHGHGAWRGAKKHMLTPPR